MSKLTSDERAELVADLAEAEAELADVRSGRANYIPLRKEALEREVASMRRTLAADDVATSMPEYNPRAFGIDA